MELTTEVGALGYADLDPLMHAMLGDEKHSSAATSTLDVIWVLYDEVLAVSPDRTEDPERDRFLLSKGHGPMAYYAVLAAHGFLDRASWPDGVSSGPGWVSTPTGFSCRAWRSAVGHSGTDCRSRSARRSDCARRAAAVRGSSS